MAVCRSDRSIGGAMRPPRSAPCLAALISASPSVSGDLGPSTIAPPGNFKLDVPDPPADRDGLQALQSAIGGRTTIAAASTHAGEEIALIDMHRRLRHSFPQLLTLIAPRHPDRGPGIAEIATAAGPSASLRSQGRRPGGKTDIFGVEALGRLS